MIKRAISIFAVAFLLLNSTVCKGAETTQSATTAVEGRKTYVTVQAKADTSKQVTYAIVPKHKMKGKSLKICFNKSVWLAKNYNSSTYKVVEHGKALKVTWKTNSKRKGKLRVGFGDGKYMTITIKVTSGVG